MDSFIWSQKSAEKTLIELQTTSNGLSNHEAKIRLEKYGRNEVITKKLTWMGILRRQVKNAMIYLLIIAAFVSLLLKQIPDAIIIFVILIINISLGFTQEFKSEKILEKLKNYIIIKAKTRRDGKKLVIDRRDLVIGDIVVLESGDIVPADLRIIKSNNLLVDESILTGESAPARKDETDQDQKIKEVYEAKNMLFAGTTVVDGFSEGAVVAIGKDALMGEIIALTAQVKHQSIFEKNIEKFSKFILKLVFFTLLVIFAVNVLIKRGVIDAKELLLFTIAMAISVIPEALPLITSLTLSIGAMHMAKKKVVVKRLSAIHDLGSVDVICTDKTGTITENVLKIQNIYSNHQEEWLIKALLTSGYLERDRAIFEPFDRAIYQCTPENMRHEIYDYGRVWHLPFDPDRRYCAIVVKKDNKSLLIVKGAPEEIIKLSDKIKIISGVNNFIKKEEELKKIMDVGLKGQRVLTVAYREIENKESYTIDDINNLIYLGFSAFSDTLKATAKEAVKRAQKLGIAIKIITGDSREVAQVVAQEIGLLRVDKKIYTGTELDQMSPDNYLKAIEEGIVFARISPIQKYKIIEVLSKNHSVGFLGEGINDAPALKLTHVAMVVDSGADVSKETADIILLEKDLKVIVDGITEGRKIFYNVIKYIKYTLISNFGNFYGMAFISLFIPFLPMLAVQILLVNLLSDIPLVAVVTDRVRPKEIAKPQKYNFQELAFVCVFLGLISTVFDIIFFVIFKNQGPIMLRTLWFLESILTELLVIYAIRTKFFFLRGGLPSWQLIGFGVIAALITIIIPFSFLGPIFHFAQPSITNMFLIFGLVIMYFICTEIAKLIYYHNKQIS